MMGIFGKNDADGGGLTPEQEAIIDDASALTPVGGTFTTTYKGIGPINEYVGEHDASAGAAPSTFTRPIKDGTLSESFTATNAKRGDVAVIMVAGTFTGTNGTAVSVSRNDLIQATVDNPTSTQWAIIKDCQAELEEAIEAANGWRLWMADGLYFTRLPLDPNARIRLTGNEGDWSICSPMNIPVIFQESNDAYAIANTSQAQCSVVTKAQYTNQSGENPVAYVTRFTCTTAADAAYFKRNSWAVAFTDAINVGAVNSSSNNNWIAQAFKVLDYDTATGYVYAQGILTWHDQIAAATNIYINTINADRATEIIGGTFQGAPTIRGNSSGWWNHMYGREVVGTFSGSGGTRTITATAHNHVVGNKVRVGNSSGGETTTCRITSITANSFTFSVPSKQDYVNSAPSFNTSGNAYYYPVFDRRDSDPSGDIEDIESKCDGAIITLELAHGSRYERCRFDALWVKGVRERHSCFITSKSNTFTRGTSALTKSPYNSMPLGRIGYAQEPYGLATGNETDGMRVDGFRHGATTGSGTTSSAWSAANWYRHGGAGTDCSYNNSKFTNGNGPLIDTHEGARNITSKNSIGSEPNQGAQLSSYSDGTHIQTRSSMSIIDYYGEGGNFGIKVALGEYQDDVYIDAILKNCTYRDGDSDAQHGACGLRIETQNSGDWTVGNKAVVRGNLRLDNYGQGIVFANQDSSNANSGVVDLDEYSHINISYSAGYIKGDGILRLKRCLIDYTKDPQNVSRFGFRMSNTASAYIDHLTLVLGSAHNPPSIFESRDNLSGKTVTVGILNIRDVSGAGIPAIIETGRDADFTLKVGLVIYNGVIIKTNVRSSYAITSTSNSIAWNLAEYPFATHTLTENTTLAAATNQVAGQSYTLLLTQHASSPKTLAFNSNYIFPAGTDFTVTATNGAKDALTFISDGTNMWAVGQAAFA